MQNSISPASGASVSSGVPTLHGPTASSIINAGSNNPLTMYLAAAHQNAHISQSPLGQSELATDYSAQTYPPALAQPGASNMSTQSAFYSSPNEVTVARSTGLEPPSHYGHGSHQSVHLTNGHSPIGMYSSQAAQHASRASHNRAVSLPAFNLQQAQQAGMANGLAGLGSNLSAYGLGVSGESTLQGWAEEEVA